MLLTLSVLQVDASLTTDPENEDLLKLKNDLQVCEFMVLTFSFVYLLLCQFALLLSSCWSVLTMRRGKLM